MVEGPAVLTVGGGRGHLNISVSKLSFANTPQPLYNTIVGVHSINRVS